MDNKIIVLLIFIGLLALSIYMYCSSQENLCVQKSFGTIIDVPASVYANANMALVHSTSLGQAPLGDPHYWIPSTSPITQGQWSLYQEKPVTLEEAQNFDRTALDKLYEAKPVYTEQPF